MIDKQSMIGARAFTYNSLPKQRPRLGSQKGKSEPEFSKVCYLSPNINSKKGKKEKKCNNMDVPRGDYAK